MHVMALYYPLFCLFVCFMLVKMYRFRIPTFCLRGCSLVSIFLYFWFSKVWLFLTLFLCLVPVLLQTSKRASICPKLAAIRDEDGAAHRGAPSGDPRSGPREDHAHPRPLHQRQRNQKPPQGLPAEPEPHLVGSEALGSHLTPGPLLPLP